jgi:hypothetical protein
MPHQLILSLRERRSGHSGDEAMLWKEVDLIIDLLEAAMEGISQTEAALAQLKSDSEARDAATQTALTDLKAEVAKIEAQGVDTTSINATISALDAAVKTGTTEAQAADPGSQQAPPPPPQPPAQPTSEQVSVSIGGAGEGTETVSQPFAQVSIASQPSVGSATLEAVEGQPGQTTVKVTGATGGSVQTVGISIAAAA